MGLKRENQIQEIIRTELPKVETFEQQDSFLFEKEMREAMKRDPPFKYEACSRSSYTHRKKRKTVKELLSRFQKEKKPKKTIAPIEEEKQEIKEETKEISPIAVEPNIMKRFKMEKEEDASSIKKISAILIKAPYHSRDHFAHKLRLMFPAGYALDILRRLVYVGAKVIGSKEHKAINSESKEFNFPEDFPLSKAGVLHSYKQAQNSLLKNCRLPPSKRFDYFRTGFAMPFRSEWRSLKQRSIYAASSVRLLPCIIYCKGRGVIHQLAYIYEKGQDTSIPTTQLASKALMKALVLEYIRMKMKNTDSQEASYADLCKEVKKIPISKQEKNQLQNQSIQENVSSLVLNQDLTLNLEGQGEFDPNVIGFVTSGGYSLKEGQSMAKGWILTDYSCKQGSEVLIRNPRGRKIVEGKVHILKSMKGTRLY